jgi:hypothetical protein
VERITPRARGAPSLPPPDRRSFPIVQHRLLASRPVLGRRRRQSLPVSRRRRTPPHSLRRGGRGHYSDRGRNACEGVPGASVGTFQWPRWPVSADIGLVRGVILLPAEQGARFVCRQEKWAILVRSAGHSCKSAPFGTAFPLESPEPTQELPHVPSNAHRIRSSCAHRVREYEIARSTRGAHQRVVVPRTTRAYRSSWSECA